MGNKKQCEALLALKLEQKLQNRGLYRHIQGRNGLVANQELRSRRQSPGDRNTLAFPARKARGIALCVGGWKANRFQEARHLTSRTTAYAQSLGKGSADSACRVEGRIRVLENDPHWGASTFRGTAYFLPWCAIDLDTSRIWLFQTDNQTRKGGLPRSRLADNSNGFLVCDRERNSIDRHVLIPAATSTENFDQVPCINQSRRNIFLFRGHVRRVARLGFFRERTGIWAI